jgi:DnaJ-domain-containing protein 1
MSVDLIVPVVMTFARFLHRAFKQDDESQPRRAEGSVSARKSNAEDHDAETASDPRHASAQFNPDAYKRIRAERNMAADAHDWSRFFLLRRQLDAEMSKTGDESLKDAVLLEAVKDSWGAVKSEIGEGLNQFVFVMKDLWSGFWTEFEHGYERAKQERDSQPSDSSYGGKREQSSSAGDGVTSFEKVWGHAAHETLGIRKGASPSEIKIAWAKEMNKHHPDRVNQSDAAAVRDATEKAKEINMARVEMEYRR